MPSDSDYDDVTASYLGEDQMVIECPFPKLRQQGLHLVNISHHVKPRRAVLSLTITPTQQEHDPR